MSPLHKASLALVALAAFGQASAANALTGLDVTPTVTSSAGTYTYSYAVTPITNIFGKGVDASQLAFTFTDSDVSFEGATGPLSTVLGTAPGSFLAYSPTGKTLKVGQTGTYIFQSPDGPNGFLNVGETGKNGAATGPSVVGPGLPVPEASTTVSLGLLLALGLGGVVVAARKKKLTA